MCYICIEYEKGKLTSKEAMGALVEVLQTETDEDKANHLYELANKIVDNDDPFEEWDSDADTGALEELDFDFDDEDD